MLCKVIKQFTFCEDGINHSDAPKDHNVEIPDHMVEGLYAEGYVAEPDEGAVAGPIGTDEGTEPDEGNDEPTGQDDGSTDLEGTGAEILEIKIVEVGETKTLDEAASTVEESTDASDETASSEAVEGEGDEAGDDQSGDNSGTNADELDELRATYKDAAGEDADKRWNAATLREKLIEL